LTRVRRAVSSAGSLRFKGDQGRANSAISHGLELAHSIKNICKICHFDRIFTF
jgi:hypothetical protein